MQEAIASIYLAGLAAVMAIVNAVIAYQTRCSQVRSEEIARKALESQERVAELQRLMNARDLAFRQERARVAIDSLLAAVIRAQAYWAGQLSKATEKHDLLEAARPYISELQWIPNCQWRTNLQTLFNTVGPGVPERASQQHLHITTAIVLLSPSGSLYAGAQTAIDTMT